ncbi:hypothetical protein [Fischerella thermalis]|uniref:Uncharacterized protein n=1 Tax=Fischerella thermalis CCMEE 5318 TaxID=2019666 RepID=A0A2N6LNH0_9CYAN|nr:hypothetical protein [Fischerella thermalis]PMB27018.1 hypothetical protein CEN46_02350 [Fischerella thermalis CCMEE 5318]
MKTRSADLTSVDCTTNCNNDNHLQFENGWVGDRLYVFNSCQSISRKFLDETDYQTGKHQFKQAENQSTNSPLLACSAVFTACTPSEFILIENFYYKNPIY